ncbi:concanavalin A-like lectin/glucanase family protein [Gregarina niphandrodes]|uniref:Concanavalin A-like lectin/glucanase family protein n=1 Tax=Gregarina niphandrodes TaxID=110365 RepID=A0A023BA14_GRENI|nr:concanavalin A-like lectin/glucanase family protein [Gregarina niphandrodes]EZG77007.1 concanavalin A-like lectin/glucanase family protein [Gregarina niphandrodes]|eukprot:XP_011129544.1 concanavalin A-like lectin/glucanase family protein [Gregarina niphandrodes]
MSRTALLCAVVLCSGVRAAGAVDPLYSTCQYVSSNYCLREGLPSEVDGSLAGGVDLAGGVGDTNLAWGPRVFVSEPPNTPHAVVGRWDFDGLFPVDRSGAMRNLHPVYSAGPDVFGLPGGASLALGASSSVTAGLDGVALDAWSLGFWFFAEEDLSGDPKTLLSTDDFYVGLVTANATGDTTTTSGGAAAGRYQVFVSFSLPTSSCRLGEVFRAEAMLLPRRWHHVALEASSSGTRFFVNNALLGETTQMKSLSGTLTVGQTGSCSGASGFLDHLLLLRRPWNRAYVGPARLLAAAPGGLETKLIGTDILQPQVLGACTDLWRLCTVAEIAELYPYLRNVGLLKTPRTRVWHANSTDSQDRESPGLLLCCRQETAAATAATTTPQPCVN